ncbi:MAG: glycogen synthase GlgA [Rhodospirillales bacterium]|nr:MAG: glycogen synthase GlgA [Rhodospirillales bacterium]
MFIVMISSELAPVAKVGGLGDVVFGLSRELEIRGNSVEIILPKYDCMWYDEIWGLHKIWDELWVPWYGGAVPCSIWFGFVHGRKCFFIEPHSSDNFYNRGCFYGNHDDPLRFAFFSKAAMEFLLKSGKQPDIIHCHDWQTGLVPVLLFEIYQQQGMHRPRACYTIHNFKHQGITGDAVLWATGLNRPDYYMHPDRLRDNTHPNAINLMKGGIVYANHITTVSPHHAWEAQHTDQGHGLGHTLGIHHPKFSGVLNGVDYDVWNPETDRFIPSHYNAWNVEAKYPNKDALRDRLWLSKEFKPLVAYVGRLDAQKGVHLIQHAMFYALEKGAQFVLLGAAGDSGINNHFWHLKHQLNNNPNCHLEIGFNEQLAHLIYAGADIMVVPSLFEPCGLAQMIAMRYGAVPLVRAVGGLVDTVFDRDHSDKPVELRNGYVFHDSDFPAIESALNRAIGLWYSFPKDFRRLVTNGMAADYSWAQSGHHYVGIYEHIRAR